MAFGKEKYFIDRMDSVLAPLTNDEIMTLIHGDVDAMREIVKKHKIPNDLLDLIGVMIDGEPTSSFVKPPKEGDIPPKKVMH
jgi:hypothetical protein